MKRPFALTILMWFCTLYAIGAMIGLLIAITDFGPFKGSYTIGGMYVTRTQWLVIAAPLVAVIAVLMAATAFALKRRYRWARISFMLIWPTIITYGIAFAIFREIPWALAMRAVIDAGVVGSIAAWLLFFYKPSRAFFQIA